MDADGNLSCVIAYSYFFIIRIFSFSIPFIATLLSPYMSAISKICPIAMLLNKGTVKSIGQTKDIINDYLQVHSQLEIPNNISDATIEVKEFDIDIGDEVSRISIKYYIKTVLFIFA